VDCGHTSAWTPFAPDATDRGVSLLESSSRYACTCISEEGEGERKDEDEAEDDGDAEDDNDDEGVDDDEDEDEGEDEEAEAEDAEDEEGAFDVEDGFECCGATKRGVCRSLDTNGDVAVGSVSRTA
jgi:hypothetical protein